VRKLKRGFGKYKGKLPFKCFNCGRVVHFAAKFPYAKREDGDDKYGNDEEEINNKSKPCKHKRGNYTKKICYSINDSISSEESDGCVSNINKE